MKTPNNYVEFEKEDFEFSEQVVGEAEVTYFLNIDFDRLFNRQSGSITSAGVPVIVAQLSAVDPSARAKSYALYDMMQKNPGYDIVFYPQYEVITERPLGIPLITNQKVKVTARLAKIKTN